LFFVIAQLLVFVWQIAGLTVGAVRTPLAYFISLARWWLVHLHDANQVAQDFANEVSSSSASQLADLQGDAQATFVSSSACS